MEIKKNHDRMLWRSIQDMRYKSKALPPPPLYLWNSKVQSPPAPQPYLTRPNLNVRVEYSVK